MTAAEQVRSTRTVLSAAAVLSALLWGAAVALATVGMAALTDWIVALPQGARRLVLAAGIIGGIMAAATVLWRARRVRSAERVALWLEERVPALRYSLVTALEVCDAEAREPLERDVAKALATVAAPTRAAVLKAIVPPAIAVTASALLTATLPAGMIARVRHPNPSDILERRAPAGRPLDRLAPLVATVTPPAYTGLASATVTDPSSIAAIQGSRVAVAGRGTSEGLDAWIGDSSRTIVPTRSDRWQVEFAMPRIPMGLRLRDGNRERLIVLEPRPDSVPVVTLELPPRDTVVRAPRGRLPIVAQAHDDFGLDAVWVELIVSSGEGEKFTFRTGTIGRVDAAGARDVTLRTELRLDSLALGAGDIVHVRAVGRDRNDVTGPGVGASETRAIRIPRRGEYDSVMVEAAPPPDVEQSQISQRMLITLAEALQHRRPTLPRSTVVAESRAIGADQARLRRHVGNVIFARLGREPSGEESQGEEQEAGGGNAPLTPQQLLAAADSATQVTAGAATDFGEDESPVVAVNRPLLEAYGAMWDATRALDIGEPGAALPHMRAALAAMERARAAERLYLRGKVPTVIVDLNRVRLAGKLEGAGSSVRTPDARLDTTRAQRAARLERALDLLAANPSASLDSLLALRVDALGREPALAAALGRATEALRTGQSATEALLLARRIAGGEPLQSTTPLWGGAW